MMYITPVLKCADPDVEPQIVVGEMYTIYDMGDQRECYGSTLKVIGGPHMDVSIEGRYKYTCVIDKDPVVARQSPYYVEYYPFYPFFKDGIARSVTIYISPP